MTDVIKPKNFQNENLEFSEVKTNKFKKTRILSQEDELPRTRESGV